MFGYHRPKLLRATEMLRRIERNPDNLPTLRELQELLTEAILSAERHIRRWKADRRALRRQLGTRGLTKEESVHVQTAVKRADARLEQYRQLIYVWKTYGDGIAFIYLDRFAVKPLYYADRSGDPKLTAGELGGKAGLARERALRDDALAHGVPALLTDLTNAIRHGDVVLLGASDPTIVEVKSQPVATARGHRQLAAIERLNKFYTTDIGQGIMGAPASKRHALPTAPRTYGSYMGTLIGKALRDGRAFGRPEAGLIYGAIATKGQRGNPLKGMPPFRGINHVFFLNEAKNERAWGSYLHALAPQT